MSCLGEMRIRDVAGRSRTLRTQQNRAAQRQGFLHFPKSFLCVLTVMLFCGGTGSWEAFKDRACLEV